MRHSKVKSDIIHAVYHVIKRFYHIHEFHEEPHDSILDPFYSRTENIDIKKIDNKALMHYLHFFEKMFSSYVNDFRDKSKKIDDFYSMPKGEGIYRAFKASAFLLNECTNALGISIYAKSLLSSKYNCSFQPLTDNNTECAFSQEAINLLNSIEHIRLIETRYRNRLNDVRQSDIEIALDELRKNIYDVERIQAEAERISKKRNTVSIFLGVSSLLLGLLSIYLATKTPDSNTVRKSIEQNQTGTLIINNTKRIVDSNL